MNFLGISTQTNYDRSCNNKINSKVIRENIFHILHARMIGMQDAD